MTRLSSWHLFHRALNPPSFILSSYIYSTISTLLIRAVCRTRVKYERSIWPRFPRVLPSLEDREPSGCLRRHRFESYRGLRFFLCVTLVACWSFHFHINEKLLSRKFYGNLKSGLKQNGPFAAFHSRGTKPLALQGSWVERKREKKTLGERCEGEREKKGFGLGLGLGRALVFFDYCYLYWQTQRVPMRRREFAFWVVRLNSLKSDGQEISTIEWQELKDRLPSFFVHK